MTAGENEFESLVWKCRRVHRVLRCLGHREQAGLGGQCAIAADAIDRAVARRRHQPGTGVGRSSVARPALRGDRKGLRRGFLGEIEVAEEADQRSEDASPLLAEGLLQDRYHSMIGRTSIAPPMLAAGIRAASSIAASRSSASKKRKPPIASLSSANGPSVVSVVPSCTRTVVAVSGGCICWPEVTPGVSLIAL